jgi:hypothetical protein
MDSDDFEPKSPQKRLHVFTGSDSAHHFRFREHVRIFSGQPAIRGQARTENAPFPGQIDTNGLAIAWELIHFGRTGVDPNADPDGDGMSNWQEYVADTDPQDLHSRLRITAFSVLSSSGNDENDFPTWTSEPTRQYRLQFRTSLNTGASWLAVGAWRVLLLFPTRGVDSQLAKEEGIHVRLLRDAVLESGADAVPGAIAHE